MNKTNKSKNKRLMKHIKQTKQVPLFIGFLSLSLSLLAGTILASNTTNAATTVVDTVVGTLPISCSLTGTDTSSHTTELSNGVLTPDIGATTLKATCNDAGGYSIFAIGYSGDTDGNTAMLSSVGSKYNIATGLPTDTPPSTSDPSSWAMKVTPGTNTTSANNFNAYHVVPANHTKVVERASGTDMGTVAAATTTYQIYADGTQAAGTYTGKVKYTLVHPSTESCPEGYELKSGTCTKKPTLSTITSMQEMTSTICTASALNETKQLKDTRDNKIYWVTKLADNNCWMTQNLDYDISSSKNTISNNDGTEGMWSYKSDYPPQDTSTSIFSTTSENGTYSYDPGDYYLPSGSGSSTAVGYDLTSSSAKGNTNLHYHLGNYYQWNAAVAGTSVLSTGSICPQGWRIPDIYGSSTNYSFEKLMDAYSLTSGSGDATLLPSPLWFVRAGYVASGSLSGQGTSGYVWSRIGLSDGSGYPFIFNSSSLQYGSEMYYGAGANVRCVAL